MLIETQNGELLKVITTTKNKETGATEIVVQNKLGNPEILTEPVKRLIFETILEMLKNVIAKLLKLKT